MNRIVLLENIRSLHNVGSVFRTCDSAGWDKVLLTGITGTPPDERIAKVSLEAETFIPWEYHKNPIQIIELLKEEGYIIGALEQTTKSEDIFCLQDIPEKLVLVLGNEVDGVSPEVLRLCDRVFEIPMYGQKTSLNVSVAGGVALYALRQGCHPSEG